MRTLRILIIIQAICLFGSVAADFLTWDTMPPLFRNYEGPPSFLDSYPALAGAVLLLSLIILIASWIGLWLGMRYSREIYAAIFLIPVLIPDDGPIFRTPWGNLLGEIDTLAIGAILALVFLTDLRHTFRPKGKGSSAKESSGSGDTSGGENPPPTPRSRHHLTALSSRSVMAAPLRLGNLTTTPRLRIPSSKEPRLQSGGAHADAPEGRAKAKGETGKPPASLL